LAEIGRSYLQSEPSFFTLKPKFKENKKEREKGQSCSETKIATKNKQDEDKIILINSTE
jgi:hypothetical protein